MKGKKFDAAEKHFEKKRIQYDKGIKYLREQLDASRKEAQLYKEKADSYELKNGELLDWIERLLEYTELPKEDVKAVFENEKRKNDAAMRLVKLFGVFGVRV